MSYLTYDEYVSLGGTLGNAAFSRNIDRASGAIDKATFNRIQAMVEVPQRAKACCRDLVEIYAVNADASEKAVASWSQSAGTVTESVTYATKTADELKSEVDDIILDYLTGIADDDGVPLLYLGAVR